MFSLSVEDLTLLGLLLAGIELIALWMVVHVLLYGRTSQGTLAWILCLLFMPFIGVPLFLLFGRRRFHGYLQARKLESAALEKTLPAEARNQLLALIDQQAKQDELLVSLESIAIAPTLVGNRAELLIDGEETFAAIFAAVDAATDYILLQSFILKADRLGDELKDRLIRKANTGVRIFLLYDAIGSYALPGGYRQQLIDAGVQVQSFSSGIGWQRRFQINFRNHRKIIVIDGRKAFIGGHNIGDEYHEKTQKYGHWRDTHLEVSGPAVQDLQLVFLDDWYWACNQLPELCWQPQKQAGGFSALVVPTGPADQFDSGSLFFLSLIQAAKQRLWLASPYYVPDETVAQALQLAALRGVDVRILLPGKADKLLPWLAAWPWIEEAGRAGVRFYRYQPGFLHQKVALVDHRYCSVGTANLDNRSLRLNFEVSLVAEDEQLAGLVEAMLNDDLRNSVEIDSQQLRRRNPAFRVMVAACRLLSPLL